MWTGSSATTRQEGSHKTEHSCHRDFKAIAVYQPLPPQTLHFRTTVAREPNAFRLSLSVSYSHLSLKDTQLKGLLKRKSGMKCPSPSPLLSSVTFPSITARDGRRTQLGPSGDCPSDGSARRTRASLTRRSRLHHRTGKRARAGYPCAGSGRPLVEISSA